MAEWFREYWQYALGLVGVCVVAFFIVRAAARAYSAHQKSFREEEKYITHLKELKEKFVPLTARAIAEADDGELLEGVALGIQLALQKFDNMEAEFERLSEEKRLIYTLDVFLSDRTLDRFFRENSSVLKSRLVPALRLISLSAQADAVAPIAAMFDDRDEEASLDEKKLAELDIELEKDGFLSRIKLFAAKYIRNNPDAFCDCD